MTWIALIDQDEGRFDPTGLSRQKSDPVRLMHQGCLMFELEAQPYATGQTLLDFDGTSIRIRSDQSLHLTNGESSAQVELSSDVCQRITYLWDAFSGHAILAHERIGETALTSAAAPLPRLHTMADVSTFVTRNVQRPRDALTYAALSNKAEPLGPNPGLLKQTRILTAEGPLPVSRLRRGDLVRAHHGGLVPVLHLISRKLPARGEFAPIRLCAPAFGLQEDLFVAAHQTLMLQGPDIEYTFGCETVLMPARHLLSTPFARPASCGSVVTYYQVILPGNEGLSAGNIALSSLNIGRIRRKPDILANSTLSGIDRKLLPEHSAARYPVLKSAESLALLDLRVA